MLGVLGLLAQGARSYARNRSRLEFRRTYDALTAVEAPPLVSTTAPVRALLVQEVRDALTAAAPEGWTVSDDLTVSDAQGPRLVVEVEAPGVMTRRGRSEEHAVPTYWLIAPVGPQITVLRRTDGEYVEVARVTGEAYAATEPFAVTVPLQAR